ncbi:hypothetical protein RJ639_013921 [Escallonia herrerae]|uniref:Uncharacterized protein n=1 Tax=Escallonia herrerae TaxID=1293975 RepID=A0AA88VIQ2_9ASTE|nr:hypothetical protein RJ639_013921 [Escallonia herrerae]
MAGWSIIFLVALALIVALASARDVPSDEGLNDQKNVVSFGGLGGYSGIGADGLPLGGVVAGIGSGVGLGGVNGLGGIGGAVGFGGAGGTGGGGLGGPGGTTGGLGGLGGTTGGLGGLGGTTGGLGDLGGTTGGLGGHLF